MFQPRIFYSVVIIFLIYWIAFFPLFWFVIKPLIIKSGVLNGISAFWIPYVFCCGAFILFIVVLATVLWCVTCYFRKRQKKKIVYGNNSTVDLYESNTYIKDQVEMDELGIEPCENVVDAYRDIQDIFFQFNSSKLKCNTASQTSESPSSSPIDDNFYDNTRSYFRLKSCEGCSKTITDEEIVNAFNKKLNNEIDMDKLVPQAQPRAKRSHIYENINSIQDEHSNVSHQQSQPRRRLKSEVFVIVNDEYSPEENYGDDVFKENYIS